MHMQKMVKINWCVLKNGNRILTWIKGRNCIMDRRKLIRISRYQYICKLLSKSIHCSQNIEQKWNFDNYQSSFFKKLKIAVLQAQPRFCQQQCWSSIHIQDLFKIRQNYLIYWTKIKTSHFLRRDCVAKVAYSHTIWFELTNLQSPVLHQSGVTGLCLKYAYSDAWHMLNITCAWNWRRAVVVKPVIGNE